MKTILIIEDQPQMRRNIGTILLMEGYQVLSAADGSEGVSLAQAELPDLILCDIMMPQMDGYAVLDALRGGHATAKIPFIFLTAKGEKTDVRAGMNLGADDYLTKPVSKADLIAAINARFEREKLYEAHMRAELGKMTFKPDFSRSEPLAAQLGLSDREGEVLLWVAQGKSNGDVASILGMSEKTVKAHLGKIFGKLGLESRTAATLRALEVLSKPQQA